MRIESAMPFPKCDGCKRCILSVKEKKDATGETVMTVRCKSETICLYRYFMNKRRRFLKDAKQRSKAE